MNKHTMSALLLAVLAGAANAAQAASAATAPVLQARVAGGARVALVGSSRMAAQWSAQRPRFRDLRPKARSNIE